MGLLITFGSIASTICISSLTITILICSGICEQTRRNSSTFRLFSHIIGKYSPHSSRVKPMKRLLLSLLVASLTGYASAQQPTPIPKPSEEQVVRINTDLIQIDVTVLDKDGKVVTGLRADDFELYENGKPQTISNFSFVSKLNGGASVNPEQTNPTIPATTTGTTPLKRADVRRTIALVVDDMNLS